MLTGSIDGLIGAMTASMAVPVSIAAALFYVFQGVRLANGDPEPMHNFVPQLVRVGVVIWLSSNLAGFNAWVRDWYFTGVPNWLAATIGAGTGIPASGLNATAATFDGIWHQIFEVAGTFWAMSGLSVHGIVAGIAGFATGVLCGLALGLMALVYVAARMLLAGVICISPILIGCAMFEYTRQFFDRAVGVVVSLILLQTLGLVFMQILLLGDTWFMAQATTSILDLSNPDIFATAMETLAGLTVWFLAGAYAIKNVPAIAYSIGGGIPTRGPSLLGLALLARSGGGGGGGGERGSLTIPSFPSYGLSMNVPQIGGPGGGGSPALSGGAQAALPAPPLAITHSTRR